MNKTELDGRSFEGVFIPRGKTSGDAETLVFKGGRLRSLACDAYGYSDGAYRVTGNGDGTKFEAQTESAKYGKILWSGIVRGGKLDATAMRVSDGQPQIENWVVAAEKA